MDLKFFASTYDLTKEKVRSIISNGECIEISIEFDININYIGNGLRSEFDYKPTHKFIVKEKYEEFNIENPKIISVKYENSTLKILLENKEINISSNEIICEQNFEVN